jgi:hypothetical protein
LPRAPNACTVPGCPHEATPAGKCADHRRDTDRRRPNANQRGYTSRWSTVSTRYLRAHPTCECDDCLLLPPADRPRADHVDHRDGLGPNGPRGYDESNFCAMSRPCHSRKTALRDGGFGN